MAQERMFIKEAIRRRDVEEFLGKEFAKAGYSHCDIQRTPLSLRITVYAHKPGLIIGRGGKNIDAMTETLKVKFGFENPQLDVQEVPNPDLDAHIVAMQIAQAIERGLNYKRVVNFTMQKVMDAGAIGIGIRVSGKVGGDMSRTEKFSTGYLKYSGEPAETMVQYGYARAQVKLGTIGIQVRIMLESPAELEISKRIRERAEEKGEEVGNLEEKTDKGTEQ